MIFYAVPQPISAFQVKQDVRTDIDSAKLHVNAGDWIVESHGSAVIMNDAEFRSKHKTLEELISLLEALGGRLHPQRRLRSETYEGVKKILASGPKTKAEIAAGLPGVNPGTLSNLLLRGKNHKVWTRKGGRYALTTIKQAGGKAESLLAKAS